MPEEVQDDQGVHVGHMSGELGFSLSNIFPVLAACGVLHKNIFDKGRNAIPRRSREVDRLSATFKQPDKISYYSISVSS